MSRDSCLDVPPVSITASTGVRFRAVHDEYKGNDGLTASISEMKDLVCNESDER